MDTRVQDRQEILQQYQEQLQALQLQDTDLVAASWYSFQGQKYPVLEIKKASYDQLLYEIFAGFSKIRLQLTRGFTSQGLICIKEGTWLARDRLIIHEIGHLLGKEHTLMPTLMHPSWFFRWFNRW